MNRRQFLQTTGIGLTAMGLSTATSAEQKTNCVIAEATKWSELVPVLKQYNLLSAGENVRRVFGYGSLIWNHGALKGEKSNQIANEVAIVKGANVDMNIYAVGADEYRGSDKSVGLYIGMTPTGNAEDVTNGLNVTIAPEEFSQAVLGFAERELGETPEVIDINKLFDADAEQHFAQVAGTPADNLKMYTFQVIKTEVEGQEKVALVVSANTKGIFYADNLDPLTSAHAILDGHGYSRQTNEKGDRAGGADLQYFSNQIKGFRERKIHHPKMEAIAEAVYRVAAYNAKHHEALSTKDIQKSVELNDEPGAQLVRTRYYLKSTPFVKRPPVPESEKAAQDLPLTGEEKTRRIAEIFNRGDLDFLAPHLAGDRSINLR